MKNAPALLQKPSFLFLITHISPKEILRFQNMQQTECLISQARRFGKNLDNAKLPGE